MLTMGLSGCWMGVGCTQSHLSPLLPFMLPVSFAAFPCCLSIPHQLNQFEPYFYNVQPCVCLYIYEYIYIYTHTLNFLPPPHTLLSLTLRQSAALPLSMKVYVSIHTCALTRTHIHPYGRGPARSARPSRTPVAARRAEIEPPCDGTPAPQGARALQGAVSVSRLQQSSRGALPRSPLPALRLFRSVPPPLYTTPSLSLFLCLCPPLPPFSPHIYTLTHALTHSLTHAHPARPT